MPEETIPDTASVRQIVVELPAELVKALKIAAVTGDTTQKAIVERALRHELSDKSATEM